MKAQKSVSADVAIIGGGITGIVSAYVLAKVGKRVVVYEKNEIGSGATADTTAFITQVLDTDPSDLVSMWGKSKAAAILDSHQHAIDLIEDIVVKEGIECEFKRCSNFLYANSPKELESLEEEYKTLKSLNIPVRFVSDRMIHGFKNSGYIEFKDQAKFSATQFVKALVVICKKRGVIIKEHSKVTSLDNIKADWKIVATYEPFNKPLRLYFKKAFYTTYVMQASLPANTIPEGMYEDMHNPYHYFRIDKNSKKSDLIMIGGEDHRSDIPVNRQKSFKTLNEYLHTILNSTPYKIKSKWTGPILEPVDGLAYIGRLDKNQVLYAMAFSGNGMTYSMIAAHIFKDTIRGTKNEWASLYDLKRAQTLKNLWHKGKDYTQEFFGGAVKNTLRRKWYTYDMKMNPGNSPFSSERKISDLADMETPSAFSNEQSITLESLEENTPILDDLRRIGGYRELVEISSVQLETIKRLREEHLDDLNDQKKRNDYYLALLASQFYEAEECARMLRMPLKEVMNKLQAGFDVGL